MSAPTADLNQIFPFELILLYLAYLPKRTLIVFFHRFIAETQSAMGLFTKGIDLAILTEYEGKIISARNLNGFVVLGKFSYPSDWHTITIVINSKLAISFISAREKFAAPCNYCTMG